MELRQLRYVIALAETLHFGRAAERMYITQSAFSQQIAKLERELGTPLFDRSTHHVRLTDAGSALVERARLILSEVDSVVTDVRSFGEGLAGTLRVGLFAEGAGELTPVIVSRFRRLHPGVTVTFAEVPMVSQDDPLMGGVVDVAFLRLPCTSPRLEATALFQEPRMVAVSSLSPYAEAGQVLAEELLEERFVKPVDAVPRQWASFWSCGDLRGGLPERTGESVQSVLEALAAVAHSGGIDTVPASFARMLSYPGVVFVPLLGAAYSTAAVVRRRNDSRPLVSAFVTTAEAVARESLHVVPGAVPPAADELSG
ncbi:LysR family transcriptional regulator [Streptomyces werraensis]|uniref:LysR family transcriptional regulator n=1 Tax=Streptomyces werraensis TaxID=68284 RepID=UPI001CE37023